MAKYRYVYTDFWEDGKIIEEFTPEDKFFFLYLLTNKHTTQIGIYQISKKHMQFELGYSQETINALMLRFTDHHKIIRYNPETREIAIKHWGRYNLVKGGKPMLDCVKSELKQVRDKSLIEYVAKSVDNNSIKALFESFYVSSNDTSHDTSDDTSTSSGQKQTQNQNQKQNEKQTQNKQLVSESVSQESQNQINHPEPPPEFYEQQYYPPSEDYEQSLQAPQTQQPVPQQNTQTHPMLNDQVFARITTYYEQNLGIITPAIRDRIAEFVDEFRTIEIELIERALTDASMNPSARNKLSYASGTLRNLLRANIHTLQAYEMQLRNEQSKPQGGNTHAASQPKSEGLSKYSI